MALKASLIDELIYEEESATLDFKSKQYLFDGANDHQKSELLKDVLAFANAWRRIDAYILIGIEEVKGGQGNVIGVSGHIDDAKLQQFVNSKTQRPIHFSYQAMTYSEKQIGVIHIPCQERPIYLKTVYGKLKKGIVYIRRGSSTSEAEPDEIAKMHRHDESVEENPLLQAFKNESEKARQLVLERPKLWEYRLTEELLSSKLEPIKKNFEDISKGLVYKKSKKVSGKEFISWASAAREDLLNLCHVISQIMNKELTLSWGELGEEGDHLAIKRAVDRMVDCCKELLRWEENRISILPPEAFQKLAKMMNNWTSVLFVQILNLQQELNKLNSTPNLEGVYTIELIFEAPENIDDWHKESDRLLKNPKKWMDDY